MSILHECERVLYEELLPSMREPGETVEVDGLAGIVLGPRQRLILLPRAAARFPVNCEVCYPAEPAELPDFTPRELLRSFFDRSDAWRLVADRPLYGAALAVAREDYSGGVPEARFATRLACGVSLGILARRGIRLLSRDGLPPVLTDEQASYAEFNGTSVHRADSLAPPSSAGDSFSEDRATISNNLSQYGVRL